MRAFSYADDGAATRLAGGESAESLLPELASPARRLHDRAGLVSLVARSDAPPPPPKERLTAVGGKLVTVRDAAPRQPNGTGFTLTAAPAPALDASAVVVGRVLAGSDVVEALAALPANRNADEEGLFFAVAKSVGDKRALVREKGSGKPLAKVVVTACGLDK